MKKQTLQITTGGALIAIFAMMLLLNRQTGGFFEEMLFYILPIPMVAYSARYGAGSGVPVMIAMVLISLIFGTVTTIFYAATQAFLGLVLGTCIYRKADMTKTLFLIMGLSVVFMLADIVLMSYVFGNDLTLAITETREMMSTVMNQLAASGRFPEEQVTQMMAMLDDGYLTRMYLVVMIMVGALQGVLVFEISLLLLNRLRYRVPKPRSVFTYYPPQWLCWVAVVMLCIYLSGYYRALQEPWAGILQAMGIFGQLYLTAFGILAVVLWMRGVVPNHKMIGVVAAVLCYFMVPIFLPIMGVVYMGRTYHDMWLQRAGIIVQSEK